MNILIIFKKWKIQFFRKFEIEGNLSTSLTVWQSVKTAEFLLSKTHGDRSGLTKGQVIKKFTETPSLNKYKIIAAPAGNYHSLFITTERKVLAVGWNFYGQLSNTKLSNTECSQIETNITCGVIVILQQFIGFFT